MFSVHVSSYLVFLFCTSGLTMALRDMEIFAWLRKAIRVRASDDEDFNRMKFIGKMWACYFCLGYWVGWVVSFPILQFDRTPVSWLPEYLELFSLLFTISLLCFGGSLASMAAGLIFMAVNSYMIKNDLEQRMLEQSLEVEDED